MLAIVPQLGADISPRAIAEHARRKMPRFARPRYVAFIDALPKTASEKVRKADLKTGGRDRTHDRSARSGSRRLSG
jgi:crotonobetaine/carnitine-CoA ligase